MVCVYRLGKRRRKQEHQRHLSCSTRHLHILIAKRAPESPHFSFRIRVRYLGKRSAVFIENREDPEDICIKPRIVLAVLQRMHLYALQPTLLGVLGVLGHRHYIRYKWGAKSRWHRSEELDRRDELIEIPLMEALRCSKCKYITAKASFFD
jgi:hypothetical protein